ncbi:MAG: helix-turn-helix domain-containing protein [Elusimicrobia bacterium]|nr:helix-turn-helix domain-containing protein [Elusimicrobiota bacterium]MBI2915585.1 helix-turn-helix domain-containing protein [Elusimicrobiota bacterium]MBI3013285.1 helix-turn-helix domain-containing protein [Elusimicrobiota bacterium]
MVKDKGRSPEGAGEAQPPISREVMDIKELSAYLGMGKSKIYALIRMKQIPASRIGRQYRFSKSVIDQWLKEKLITKGEEPQMPLTFPQESLTPPNHEPAS